MDKENEDKIVSKLDEITNLLKAVVKEQRDTKLIFSKYDEQYLTEMEEEGPMLEG